MHLAAEAGRHVVEDGEAHRAPSLALGGARYDRTMSIVAPAVSKVMAHRGGRHGGSPNSVDAIAHAHAVGAASAEIDVNVTADGVLLATHDGILPGSAWITEVTFDELQAADAE